MTENNVTSTANMMRLNIHPNGVYITRANCNGIVKTVSQPEANIPLSNTLNNPDQNLNQKQCALNSKDNNLTTAITTKWTENLHQLSTNALPPYVPASPSNVIKADTSNYEYHCCTDCGDTFALKSSLKFHFERRSVLIKFTCDACRCIQIFYNRCTLLSHIRSHKDKEEISDINKAVVNPLPRVFMDGLQGEITNTLDDELISREDNTTPPTDLLEFSLNVEDNDPIVQNSAVVEEKTDKVKVKCLDCNEEFKSFEERAQHLTQNDKIPETFLQCNKCNMVCPSKCFLKAHQRIHLQISPYVCPECGDSPSPLWLNFQFHVKYKCFHNTRTLGYKCPVCKRLASSNDSLLKHMELHTERYAKCDSCPRAYLNVPSFNKHIAEHHPNRSSNTNSPKYNMIYKCSLCDIVFLSLDQMLTHRPVHLKEQICEYVFSCMQCGKPLETKSDLYDHIKGNHPKIFKHIEDLAEPIKKPEITKDTYSGTVECMLCKAICYSSLGYVSHLAKMHCNFNQTCSYCFMLLKNRKEMVAHGKKHIDKGCTLCLLCNNKKWNDKRQLDAHLVKHVDNIKYCTFCPVCDKMLKTLREAVLHLREEHKLFHKSGSKNLETIEMVTCHFCRDSFGNDKELQDHLKAKHQIDTMKRPESELDDDNENEDSSKKARLEGNVCAKCNYHSLEREDFKKHILSHKTNRSTFQCQDCGLCFVVEPALVKHLRIVHKISDTKKYIEEEGTNCLPDFESQAEVSACNSLICSVCFTTFPNETSLKTHMRSHGMAFIQAAKSTSSVS